MRNNIINIRANFVAVVARVRVVAVDVIRSASASCLRLYGHSWQQYGHMFMQGLKTTPPTTCKPTLPCDALPSLGGGLSGLSLLMPRWMRLRTSESLGLIPRS